MKQIALINLPQQRKRLTEQERRFAESYSVRFNELTNINTNNLPVYDVSEVPLWIPTIGAILENTFYKPQVTDLMPFSEFEINYNKIFQKIDQADAEVYMFSPFTNNYHIGLRIAEHIKRSTPDARTVIGGSHASFTEVDCLNTGLFDIVVRGEGELTVKELAQANFKDNLSKVKGISFKDSEDNVRITEDRSLVADINKFPIPAYHLIPDSCKNAPFFRVYTSRGCPYDCSFCADTIWKHTKVRYKNKDYLERELKDITSKFDVEYIYLGDESSTLNRNHFNMVSKLFDRFERKWICQTRANAANEDILKKAKNSRCEIITFGAESANQNILDLANKRIKLEDITSACRNAKDARLAVSTYWLIGLPGETAETARETIDYISQLMDRKLLDLVEYFQVCPYPGTKIYADPQKYDVTIEYSDFSEFREDSVGVMQNKQLSAKETYDLWLSGLEILSEKLRNL